MSARHVSHATRTPLRDVAARCTMPSPDPTLRSRARRGLFLGLGFGLAWSGASLALATLLMHRAMGIASTPASTSSLLHVGATVALALAIGVSTAALPGRWMTRWPNLPLHLLVLAFVGLALAFGHPTWRPALLFPSVAAYVLVRGLARLGPRRGPLVGVGVGGLAAVGVLGTARTGPPVEANGSAGRAGPDVLWVTLDTVRPDHVEAYGYDRPTSPHLAALTADGAVFERAYAPSSWTLPSHASMFTGTWPSRHGCHDEHRVLDTDAVTVAEQLAAHGYDTALFTGNPFLDEATGLAQGFDHVVSSWRESHAAHHFFTQGMLEGLLDRDKGAAASNAALLRWLDTRGERPFFAFVNYLEAHVPYDELPAADRARFTGDAVGAARDAARRYLTFLHREPDGPPPIADVPQLRALYDGGIVNVDRHLGGLVDALRARGTLDDTLIVVTSDHGESFGEGGRWEHGLFLSEEVTRVVLVLRWPGRVPAGARRPELVSLVDVAPTVLEAAGLPVAPGIEGRSLFGPLAGTADPDRAVFAEQFDPDGAILERRLAGFGGTVGQHRITSVQVGDLRLVRGPDAAERLFDVRADPELDLAGERPDDARALSARLDAFAAGRSTREKPGGAPLDPTVEARLRELGYVE